MSQSKPKLVQRQTSVTADAYYCFYGLFGGILLGAVTANIGGSQDEFVPGILISFLFAVGVATIFISRHLLIKSILSNRADQISLMASSAQPPWVYDAVPELQPSEFLASSIMTLAPDDAQFTNYAKTEHWSYADYGYDVYQETRYGRYQSATVYYGILAVPLPRILPNVLFDSKRDRGQQFKAKFSKDQIHVLEGNFSNYFTTYFAEDYTIDSMSFITPEVMEALIDADDYDIEIIGNHLLLYGMIYQPDLQISDMAAKAEAITQKLMNNITVYRDDRLPADVGKQTVTTTGMYLKRRGAHLTIGAVLIVIYIILKIVTIFAGKHT